MTKMGSIGTGLRRTGSLTAVALVVFVAHRLSPSVANLLALWIMLSVPLGIAVGHCALDER